MTLRKVIAIARKEFLHLIRDVRGLGLAFAFPLLLIILFGYALSLDVDNVTVVVVDHDRTSLTRDLIDKINASSYFNVIKHVPTTAAAIDYLDRGWTTVAVILPPGLTHDLTADREAAVQVLIDGSDPNFASLTRGYITGFFADINQQRLKGFLVRHGQEDIHPPIESRIRVWFNEDLESRNFIVPGIIAVIIMIVGAILTSLVIAREYENGTMETLLTLPIGAGEFLVGKAIPYFAIALIDVLVAVLMGQVLFDVAIKGSFWLMVCASCLYLLVALTLGLLISILTKSQLLANQLAVLTTYLPSLMLSDFVFPISNMPVVLQAATTIMPATYYINILKGVYLKNLGFAYLWSDYAVLTLMVLFLVALNVKKLKEEGM